MNKPFIRYDVAKQIKRERLERNMTQRQFARFLGIDDKIVEKWEMDGEISMEELEMVCEKCRVDCKITFRPMIYFTAEIGGQTIKLNIIDWINEQGKLVE